MKDKEIERLIEMVKQSDEEFVRSVWVGCCIDEKTTVQIYKYSDPANKYGFRGHVGLFASWSAAADFTRERLEQVRQLREEIEYVRTFLKMPGGSPHPVWTRISIRLESILTDKTSGMKAGA